MAQKQAAEAGDNIKAAGTSGKHSSLPSCRARSWRSRTRSPNCEQVKIDRKAGSARLAQADGIELEATSTMHHQGHLRRGQGARYPTRYVRHGEILEWLGMIPSFQPDMFRDRMPAVERREKQGELAGLANKPRESGFAKNSEDDQAWLQGF
jgi:hypothetical protein